MLIKLADKGFNVEWHGSKRSFDILANNMKIEVKSCNYDNDWAKKAKVIGGFDRINPEKFDYLICISFNENFDNIRSFIFTKEESKEFPDVVWKDSPRLKNLTFTMDDDESMRLIKLSENKWNKLIKI